MLKRDELQDKVFGIYCNGLSEDYNFYAREADEVGLVAVYEAGIEVGSRIDMRKLKATLETIEKALDTQPILSKNSFGQIELNPTGFQLAKALEAARSFLSKLVIPDEPSDPAAT